MADNTQRDQERAVALAQAVAAANGQWNIAGQANGDLLRFDALLDRYVPVVPTAAGEVLTSNGVGTAPTFEPNPTGGPPGTWRTIAAGTVVLAHNVNTNVVAAFSLAVGETHLALLTPISDANGVNNILSGNTNGSPGNGNTFWMVQENGAGTHNFQARQQNLNTAARSYEYALFARS